MNACIVILVAIVASSHAGFLNGGDYNSQYGHGRVSHVSYAPTYTVAVRAPVITKTYVPTTVVRTVHTSPTIARVVHSAPIVRTVSVANYGWSAY